MPAIRPLICCISALPPAQIAAKPGLPLGVRRNVKYQERTLAIQPGDAIFVCSDGVFEALNENGDLFSIERLNRELSAANGADPVEIVGLVKSAVDAFTGSAPKADDVTALALRWRPAEKKLEQDRSTIRSVDVAIHNDLSEIAVVRDALDRLGSEFDVPARALMHLQVALDEIVSNVVKYSWPDGAKHELLVRMTVSAGWHGSRYLRRRAALRSAGSAGAECATRGTTAAPGWGRDSYDEEARR